MLFSICKIEKEYFLISHEKYEDHYDRRLQFWRKEYRRIKRLFNICFWNEFFINYSVNRYDSRYWSDEIIFRVHHSQYLQKLWAAILGTRWVGYILCNSYINFNGETYMDLLKRAIDTLLADIVENDSSNQRVYWRWREIYSGYSACT